MFVSVEIKNTLFSDFDILSSSVNENTIARVKYHTFFFFIFQYDIDIDIDIDIIYKYIQHQKKRKTKYL